MLKCCSSRTNLQLQSVTADTLQRNINNQKLFEALFEWAIHPQRWNSVPANSSTPQIKPGKKKVKIMLAKKDNSVSNSSLFRYIYIVKYHAPGGEGGGGEVEVSWRFKYDWCRSHLLYLLSFVQILTDCKTTNIYGNIFYLITISILKCTFKKIQTYNM